MNLLDLLETCYRDKDLALYPLHLFTHIHTQLISMKAKYRLKVAAVGRQWSRGE